MTRLGELLLAEKLVTPAQLEEALETQVIHGGRLGTNLVELGFVKEAELARVLGRQHNLPFAAGEMVPDPSAVKLADKDFLDDADIMPMRLDGSRLTVAITSPRQQVKAVDDLSFKTGRRVVQVVIPEFRMNQLLRKYCGAFRPVRPIDMNTLRPSKSRGEGEPKPANVSDLINEDDFASIYAKAVGGVPEEEEIITGEVVIEEAQAAPRPSIPSVSGVSMPEAPEPATVDFAQAQALLKESADREEIARVVLRFAKGKFKRALLLAVQGDIITGWHGMGEGVRERMVRRIGVSLREENTFKLVRDLRSHFVGPLKSTPGMDVFFKLLGGEGPKTAVLMPLLVRGKPVHMLYLDNGPKKLTPPDVGELLIVSQSVSRSYEALIRARKAAQAAS